MPQTKTERFSAIHEASLREFDQVQKAVREVRLNCLDSRRFYSIPGAQWEGPLGEQFENRVKLEFNMVHLAVIRIINEYRNNRVTADFIPKDGESNMELAETCDGLYRADERDSNASEAYDNAFEEAAGGGIGAWRLRAKYEDEEDDENTQQRVCMEPIFDADSCVFFDLGSKRQDKADAKKCWVLKAMTFDAFEEQFGHSPSTWPKDIRRWEFDWNRPDEVYVAEYYVVEQKSEVVHIYRGLDETDMEVPDSELQDDPDKAKVLQATGFREVRQKRRKATKVHKYILSGQGVEEDCGVIAGKNIPIVMVYGKRWYVDGIERAMGHVEIAKDAQRLQNSLMSWLSEIATRFDVEKPILTPQQIQGFSTMWANDNVERFPYLLLNALKDSQGELLATQPIGYTRAPNVPPAMAMLVQFASTALSDLLGNQQAGEQVQPNISGKAIQLIQQRLDMQAYIYMDNFKKGVQRAGEIWLSMMKDLIVEEKRRMKTMSSDGQVSSVVMNDPSYDDESGTETTANDLSAATFDVWADVGPSSSSRRSATVSALTQLSSITDDPQTKQALTIATIANLEGEGLDDLRDWARKAGLKMGVVKPTKEEAAELAQAQSQQQQDPNSTYLIAAAGEADAGAAQKRADTVNKIADANLKQAQAQQIQAKTSGEHPDQQIAAASALHDMLQTQQPRSAQ